MPTQLTRNVHTELRTAYLVFEIHSWGGVGCPSMEMVGRRIEAKAETSRTSFEVVRGCHTGSARVQRLPRGWAMSHHQGAVSPEKVN